MKNLNELNVNELNSEELLAIDGGIWEDLAYGVGYVAGRLYAAYRDIEPQVYQRW
ncbi:MULTISPECIES: class IIb bacteriocin, lactobin A/cerein 7B family [unclassified Flavobacterium]|uniref:class IIb bacteriocin, lactobin A/cerein 7B family n=1 Tax=unclassified Flavobacterium TaxID=196869 RepID=UPI0010648E87|nr:MULTISPECIES: class IIb bacteriocin, lactobin A/cerein 7B family [unclassified Flavobacterium]TDX14329.1 hypothetical protein EDB96_1063 [Flavobacterium sp. S87F.05.LMB.W.Kidney.N]BDU24945.1 hypothetical protein FLGSB24_16890 [Flavobacterium sp. GSB-24]